MLDIGILVLRLVIGLYVAAHGAQKLFGWFGALDAILHPVRQLGRTRDEGCARHLRNCGVNIGRSMIGKRVHGLARSATCWMATTMLGYAPQRQMLPLMHSRISAADPVRCSLSSATADMI